VNPQLFGVGVQGRSPVVTAQRRVNCYYDIQPEADRAQVAIYGRPGLTLHDNLGETRIRGMFPAGPYLYVVHRDSLYEILNDGTHTGLGTLDTSTGDVYFAIGHLNASSERHMMLVDGTSGYYVDVNASSRSLTKITDASFPSNPQSVTYVGGYFVVNEDAEKGRFDHSQNADDAVNWNSDFSSASTKGDKLLRVFGYEGVLGLLGTESTEYWAYTGDASFVYANVLGQFSNWGLAARASVAEFGDTAVALMQSTFGEAVVQLLHPAGHQTISTPDLGNVINGYSTVADAIGTSFMIDGHLMYLLTFPTAGKTWCYDQASNLWSEWETGGQGGQFRGAYAAVANNKIHLGDFENGKVYRFDKGTYTDNSEEIARELISQHVFDGNRMLVCSEFWVDMEEGAGVQTGQGADPEVMLSVSRDKGRTFGNEHWANLGKVGQYRKRARWRRLGAGTDFVFKLRMTDPVPFVVTGERITLRPGAA